MLTIKRIGLSSAFKVGAIVGLITAAVLGLFFVGIQGLLVSAILGLESFYSGSGFDSLSSSGTDMMTAFGLAGLCFFYIMYVVFSAIGGGIGGIVTALAYNLAARWVGGLELEVEQEPGKNKRSYDFDDIYE